QYRNHRHLHSFPTRRSSDLESHNHSKVTFFNTVDVHCKETFRLVWNVVFAVCGWLVLFVGIDAQHGEITGVTRPHPVVSVTTELDRKSTRLNSSHVKISYAV